MRQNATGHLQYMSDLAAKHVPETEWHLSGDTCAECTPLNLFNTLTFAEVCG